MTGNRSFALTARSTVPLLAAGMLVACAEAQVPNRDGQIAEAVQAAPAEQRDGATIYGFDADGTMVTIREGTNGLICRSDDPTREGWEAACYHDSLEPFMARGRELRAEGVTDAGELQQRRWAEADAGTLAMPEAPATLYILIGDGFDMASETVQNSYLRWVIYTPYATVENTGLSTDPGVPGSPWLMFPGTAGAHIMIMPPPNAGG